MGVTSIRVEPEMISLVVCKGRLNSRLPCQLSHPLKALIENPHSHI